MSWKCKYCIFACDKRGYLLKHYRIKHGSYARSQPFPCMYQECLCTFKSFNSLKIHLSRVHTANEKQQSERIFKVKFPVSFVIFLNLVRLLNFLPTFDVDISKTTKNFSVHFKAVTLKAVCVPHSVHTKASITKIKMRHCVTRVNSKDRE